MTNQESLELVREILKAPDEEKLEKIVSVNLPRIDGTFFSVLNQSVQQLRREDKPEMAEALESLSDRMLRMKTLI